jgi:hypothetical protein
MSNNPQLKDPPQWEEWRPPYASHVVGRWTKLEAEPDGAHLPQTYTMTCELCNQSWGPTKCTSGLIKNHIATFAIQHLHRSPLEAPTKKVT